MAEAPKPPAPSPLSAARPPAPMTSIAKPVQGVSGALARYKDVRPPQATNLAAMRQGSGFISILLTGTKGSSKTCSAIGLMKDPNLPPNARMVILTYDRTTVESLFNHWGGDPWFEKLVDDGRIVLHEMFRPAFQDGKEVYPGFDSNRPETAEIVVAATMAILEELEKDRPAILMVDHLQAVWDELLKWYSFHKAGVDPLGKLEFQAWQPRTNVGNHIHNKMFKVPTHRLVSTGYSAEEKTTMKMVDGKTTVIKEAKLPRYLEIFQRDYLVILENSTTIENAKGPAAEGKGTKKWWCEVVDSRTPSYPMGIEAELPYRHGLAVFFDPPEGSMLAKMRAEREAEKQLS